MQLNSTSKKSWTNDLYPTNILILGKGYIGNELYKYLKSNLGEEHDVFIVSREELDYGNLVKFNNFCLNNAITEVINCSGFTGRPNVDEAEVQKQKCLELNVVLPLKLADCCQETGLKYYHMSSGCIYTGYDKEYTEEDEPNFGMYDCSSFYSKTKHLFEILSKQLRYIDIIRLRMPICDNYNNPRNYVGKILKYENLIDLKNSKTYIPDLCEFTRKLLMRPEEEVWTSNIWNAINPEPLTTREVLELVGIDPNTKNWVDIEKLDIKAPRSNCVLDSTKAMKIHQFKKESEIYGKKEK